MLAGGLIQSGVCGKVVSVDLFVRCALEHFKEREVDRVIDFYKGDSVKVASLFDDGTFRCVFIDGSHTYEGVKADFEAWSPKLVDSGELAFHDSDVEGYNKNTKEVEGVKPFLKMLEGGGVWKKQGQVHTLSWWVRC